MKLAIKGGNPIRTKLFPKQRTFEIEEYNAVEKFIKQFPVLSRYRGNAGKNFWGGDNVQLLEKKFIETIFENKENIEHKALAVNSCTSALQIVCGALGIKPGDEVIVTPYSMCCSATAPILWGGIPIFADVENDYFCLDYESVKSKINERTKAIIVVDLFGQPFDYRIKELADKYDIYVIEDAAQAIGSKYKKMPAGTIGDIGCYSFTQGKHLTAGEGGMIITDDEVLYNKCALLRNHAESVINDYEYHYSDIQQIGMVGFNMRMTEIQSIILLEQLKKLKIFVQERQENIRQINNIDVIPGIKAAKIRKDCTHSYYVGAFHYDQKEIDNIHRDIFINAVKAELTEETDRIDRGIPIGNGYIKPLYKFPLFEKRNIEPLPNVEKLYTEELFLTLYQQLNLKTDDINDIVSAFIKVYENRKELI